ncbi:bile acid:sodium symporter family protein [Phaeacidiphilus oryzae]|uniref:bile acid:sodium symporter family protein n=1 Tax=Phaeacidiphilus oryzae TaxID=348818 RepID=UPI00069167D4|nr:bile acid:sodium symporter [Phaeacidiphilus oryzae]
MLAVLQRRLLLLMVGAYLLAAVLPGPGSAVRAWHLTPILLGAVVFNAGLTARLGRLPRLLARPGTLLCGVAANALLPAALLASTGWVLAGWHNHREGQSILLGLAVVGAMPVAAGATVFVQSGEGDDTLALGMVLGSTLLSPLTIPLALTLAGWATDAASADRLRVMAAELGPWFALPAVAVPCSLGLTANAVLHRVRRRRRRTGAGRGGRGERSAALLPWVKLSNLAVVLTLSYSNACGAMGMVTDHPDPDYLALAVAAAGLMCLSTFLLGWWLARRLGLSRADAIAVTYASGMSNTSAGAVVAATRLPAQPMVLVPILAFSLLQKLAAGAVAGVLPRCGRRRPVAAAEPG